MRAAAGNQTVGIWGMQLFLLGMGVGLVPPQSPVQERGLGPDW